VSLRLVGFNEVPTIEYNLLMSVPILPEHLHSQLYAAILARIINGDLPPGARLVEEELARTHKVSRTPIRERLVTLHRDGLVERVRNRGARVASFTADDVEEIYEIRKALECLGVPNAVRTLKWNGLLELERRLDTLNRGSGPKCNQQQGEIDLRLHQLIVAHSGNRRLIAYLDNLSMLIHSLRLMAYRSDQRARQSGEEHLAIVRAFLRRDVELAQRLLAEHIETGKREALELFIQAYKQNSSTGRTAAEPVSPVQGTPG
jgi:DNA-binding GntR family transcriptional regulator